tara:strand:- start:325 stop:429 length:105 start_codon:yes stop_codon:yes gene_type:complete
MFLMIVFALCLTVLLVSFTYQAWGLREVTMVVVV